MPSMDLNGLMDELNIRILRITEDMRAIQQELNCAAMEAQAEPELMEALTQMVEQESLQVLKSALDQMRHFLWFFNQVMNNDSDEGDRLRQAISKAASTAASSQVNPNAADRLRFASDATMLRYLAEAKNRKPN